MSFIYVMSSSLSLSLFLSLSIYIYMKNSDSVKNLDAGGSPCHRRSFWMKERTDNLRKLSSMALKSMALAFAFRSVCFSKHACTAPLKSRCKTLVARPVRSNQHKIAQCAIRKKQNLQLFSPCISAILFGVCAGIIFEQEHLL